MKFPGFKEFKVFRKTQLTIEDVIAYLTVDMSNNLKELLNGLNKLSFSDNFESFESTVTIAASSEISVRNTLNVVPSGKIILKTDNNAVVDGDTVNNLDFVFLKNPSGSSATVTVRWFK